MNLSDLGSKHHATILANLLKEAGFQCSVWKKPRISARVYTIFGYIRVFDDGSYDHRDVHNLRVSLWRSERIKFNQALTLYLEELQKTLDNAED